MCLRKSTDAPLFSVILPTRDRPEMLQRAVCSVLRQSLREFELIVVDDASDPCVRGLPQDPRIRIIRNASSAGVAQARNVGIETSRGSYISFLDDDDEFLPSFLYRTWKGLRNSPPEVAASWVGVKFFDYPADPRTAPTARIVRIPKHKSRQSLIADFLSIGTSLGFTIKAGCLMQTGPFNRELKVASDTDLFLRILENGFLPVGLSGVHITHHNHRGQRLTSSNLYRERARVWEERIFLQHAAFFEQNPVLKESLAGYVEALKAASPDLSLHDSVAYSRGSRPSRFLSRLLAIKNRLLDLK